MFRKPFFAVLCLLVSLTGSAVVMAEQVYVSDTLRVGVRPEPDNRTAPLDVVLSGMRLEVLERREGYLRVRTEKGSTGWVREAYVVSSPPATVRLQALKAEQARLASRLAESEAAAQALEKANQQLLRRIDDLTQERLRLIREQARLQVATAEPRPFSATWMWWLLGVAVVAAAGFFTGITWYRQSVMRRLGGLRV